MNCHADKFLQTAQVVPRLKYQQNTTAGKEWKERLSLPLLPTGHMSCVRWGFADSLSVRVEGLGAFV